MESIIVIAVIVLFYRTMKKLSKVTEACANIGLDIAVEEIEIVKLEYDLEKQKRLRKIQEKANKVDYIEVEQILKQLKPEKKK